MGDRWWLGAVLGLAVLGLLPACAPIVKPYRYVSLEDDPDARVVQRARPSPGERHWSVGEIPVLYEIDRDAYTLRLAIDPETFTPVFPALTIHAIAAGGRSLEIEPDRPENAGDCPHWVIEGEHPAPGPVGWVLGPGCDRADGPPDPVIRFSVVQDDGTVMGREAIPYTVKKDGFFLYYDAV